MTTTEMELRSTLNEIACDLRVAILQSLPSDDQIILNHVKAALYRAETALRKEIAA